MIFERRVKAGAMGHQWEQKTGSQSDLQTHVRSIKQIIQCVSTMVLAEKTYNY